MNFYALPLLFISYSIRFFLVCHCQEFYSHEDFSYEQCRAGERCGNSILKYPFYCVDVFDSFTASCDNSLLNNTNYVVIRDYYNYYDYYDEYRILDDLTESSYVNHTITLRVTYDDLSECSSSVREDLGTFLGSIPTGFRLSHEDTIHGTLLHCREEPSSVSDRLNSFQSVACPYSNCTNKKGFCFFSQNNYSTIVDLSFPLYCSLYGLIVPKNYNITAMKENLRQYLLTVGFRIAWTKSAECQSCETSHGMYATTHPDGQNWDGFICVCPKGMHQHNCSGPMIHTYKRGSNKRFQIILGISLGVAFLSIAVLTIHLWRKLRKSERNILDLRVYMDSIDSRPASVENCLQGYASGPTRYSYRQIKKYTNNFRDKLRQGGFGQVFKGKLPNGSLVAVKLLDKSRQSEQQFLNEVATIGRIHHLHLVRLLGYCFQKSKRALVYEYMINGSLEKYIHGSQETHPDHVLDWKQLYSIAIGTARGIAYLHEDCANRILHCHIKPHNVLLDANYSPRVADFGLAKLGKREESHMSITAARGTPGYAAPEMWSRNHGPVTDKSDVYSYGMLLMEMVGGRKNMDLGGSRSSQIYFPEWAFKQVEKGEFGNLRMRSEVGGINTAEDENIAKKLTLIGLSCIHYDSSHRPSMVKIIQMLEGSVQVTTPAFPFPAYVPSRPAALSGESSSELS